MHKRLRPNAAPRRAASLAAPTTVLYDECDGTYAVGVALREEGECAAAIAPIIEGEVRRDQVVTAQRDTWFPLRPMGRPEAPDPPVDTNDPCAVVADFQRKRR